MFDRPKRTLMLCYTLACIVKLIMKEMFQASFPKKKKKNTPSVFKCKKKKKMMVANIKKSIVK